MRNSITYPEVLPITAEKERIIETIRHHQVVVIAGDTGSGKSTQIPKMCLEAGRGVKKLIGCTQPRRLAATSVAARVREELGPLSYLVGYKIRFSNQTIPATRIKFMTDGILLAETQNDPDLRAYDTIIIDEAHERSLNIDFLLGILKKILKKRADLKIIITSATIDTEKFSRAFAGAPVIKVSGRTYPVEIRYAVADEDGLDESAIQDLGYVEQAAQAVMDLCRSGPGGDMLVFMPTERDIRDTIELLGKRFRNDGPRLGIKESEPEMLPLFGRLSGLDQNRIFRKSSVRKIVVCTNVAETSVTVPGIRYVVDTGLARISTYNVRAQTTKLPVSSISRASCDQRAGRCGRVAPGICVRLYSEEEYLGRPEFTLPEIVRANLAEVILRMVALRLGSPKKFPFIDPPAPRAIHDGYQMLTELGAIDKSRRLTERGKLMAGLPLDPRISRMIISSRENGCLREVVIIAAALSIQDPRIRPTENAQQADAAHERFRSERSDFLSYLQLWDLYDDLVRAKRSRSAIGKFCKNTFLAYQRMREWRDIHEQIWSQLATAGNSKEHHLFRKSSCLDELVADREKRYDRGYDQIHQAILSGSLRNIGLKKEKNIYQGGQGKEFMIFPGSAQFNRAGQWIMAAELVETSRLYARTVAGIRSEWLEPLAGELCRYSYSAPHWEKKSGQVTALAKITLFGLVIEANRRVNFGPIKPEEARQIFIQSALVERECGGHFDFLEKNRQLIASLADLEDRLRRRDILVDDFLLYEFYDKRLPADVFDRAGLIRLVKKMKGDDFLCMQREDILRQLPERDELADYPQKIHCGELTLPLSYSFTPGEEQDGVTVNIPADLTGYVQAEKFEWLVPGLLLEKIIFLLKGLPKFIRRQLIPIPRTAAELLPQLRPYEGSLYQQLEDLISRRFRLQIDRGAWPRDALPEHLKMRCQLVDGTGKPVAGSRDFAAIMKNPVQAGGSSPRLEALRSRWEKPLVQGWDFAGVPQRITIKDKEGQLAGFAYPGLVAEDDSSVSLRLFADPEEQRQQTVAGLRALYCLQFARQCKALPKDLVLPRASWPLYQGIASHEEFHEDLFRLVLDEIFKCRTGLIPDQQEFDQIVQNVTHQGLHGPAMQIMDQVVDVLRERRAVLDFIAGMEQTCRKKSKLGVTLADCTLLRQEVTELLPPRFLQTIDLSDLSRFPRYLKALRIRLERKMLNPAKDAEKAAQLAVHQERLKHFRKQEGLSSEQLQMVREYALMIEEFKVSLFAQELKTSFPISAKRLDKMWSETRKAFDNF
ncbi:MAG: ATP-dependent RNA helicase HrpA [Proteobacteria bacterium]|nr:ATP-dependent RNA helicase HrpA [Pseudomonadota bacterium]MBU4295050.1 ATP-dependent RNA helicase HrpA [Pseudomonadota bacterium]MCG2746598.1 ATP-dependent RNA helicase HrpA [Desulfobulbaceae bacterium]